MFLVCRLSMHRQMLSDSISSRNTRCLELVSLTYPLYTAHRLTIHGRRSLTLVYRYLSVVSNSFTVLTRVRSQRIVHYKTGAGIEPNAEPHSVELSQGLMLTVTPIATCNHCISLCHAHFNPGVTSSISSRLQTNPYPPLLPRSTFLQQRRTSLLRTQQTSLAVPPG